MTFPADPLPQGALTQKQLFNLKATDTKVFYVSLKTPPTGKILARRASQFIGKGPGCYFTNWLFAYAHSLRVKEQNQ